MERKAAGYAESVVGVSLCGAQVCLDVKEILTQTGFLGGTMLVDWALNDFSVQDQPEQRQQCIKGTNWGR